MTPAVPVRDSQGIGEVLARLRPEFPDVTVSKIRFLETEGLVHPGRTPAGYRKFSGADVERLRQVLRAQRDQHLPLKVIRERLDTGAAAVAEPPAAPEAGATRLTRAAFLEAAGIDESLLRELEGFGLVVRRGRHYDASTLEVATLAGQIAAFGLRPRHLRAFKAAADREAGLVEQVTAPLLRHPDPAVRARAKEVARELTALLVRVHAALLAGRLPVELSR